MRREPSQEEVLALLPEVEFLISERAGIINAAMFEAGRNLRLVQRLGRQTWDIDLEAGSDIVLDIGLERERRNVVSSIHTVNTRDFDYLPYQSIDQFLQGVYNGTLNK